MEKMMRLFGSLLGSSKASKLVLARSVAAYQVVTKRSYEPQFFSNQPSAIPQVIRQKSVGKRSFRQNTDGMSSDGKFYFDFRRNPKSGGFLIVRWKSVANYLHFTDGIPTNITSVTIPLKLTPMDAGVNDVKAGIRVMSTQHVKPDKPTPENLRSYKLSAFDQINPPNYIPFVFFYANNTNGNNDNLIAERSKRLKESLSKTLTQFYPYAGKHIDDNHINCNDEGVYYVETRIDGDLSSFIAKPDYKLLQKLLSMPLDLKEPTRGFYISMIQENFFSCGGVGISIAHSHKLVDGCTYMTFLKAWASLANGDDDQQKMAFHPNFDASSLFPPNTKLPMYPSFPLSLLSVTPFTLRGGKSATKRFRFDASTIQALRSQVSSTRVIMERYFKKRSIEEISSSSGPSPVEIPQSNFIPPMSTEIDSNDIPWDPYDRKKIEDYHPNERDIIRRKYLAKGPCQPKIDIYPKRLFGKRGRRFNSDCQRSLVNSQPSTHLTLSLDPPLVVAVTSFIWKCATAAARKLHREQTSILQIAVNLRPKCAPPLPSNAIGNIAWSGVARCEPDDNLTLDSMVGHVKDGIAKVHTSFVEQFKGEQGCDNVIKEIKPVTGEMSNCDAHYYMTTSVCNFGAYDADFGWKAGVGDGIEALVTLSQEEMDLPGPPLIRLYRAQSFVGLIDDFPPSLLQGCFEAV
ncbi:hypothetical protein LXL04_003452 [Taraxacum kok-saghyz]